MADDNTLRPCLHWRAEGERIACGLCPHACRIADGNTGVCRVRRNVAGTLRSLNYGQVTSAALDPVEKKPLYHFYPGSLILSLGTWGCNLSCRFCQNWQISQGSPRAQHVSPQLAVEHALELRSRGNIGIAYTYSEPIVWYEYVLDTARLARAAGLKNVLVTNGLIEEEPLRELLPLVDAMNVDIKSISDDFYRRLCGISSGRAARRTVELAWGHCAVEITNLLVTDANDAEDDVRALVDWAASVSPFLPLHFSRYRPEYRHTSPPTPVDRIQRAIQIAREKLHYVYAGNILLDGASDTLCPSCGAVAVARSGYDVHSRLTGDGRCPGCGGDVHVLV